MSRQVYRDSDRGFYVTIAILVLLVAIGAGVTLTLRNHGTHVDCLRLHENTGLATKVARSGVTTECYVRTPDGNWVPAERYRGTDDAS